MNNEKLLRVIKNMHSVGLKQLLISSPVSIKYLTGLSIGPGERLLALIVRDDGRLTLIGNKLFALAKSEDFELIEYSDTDDTSEVIKSAVSPGTLGVDKDLRCRFALPFMKACPETPLVLGSECVDKARMLKTSEEIALMRESSLKNDAALESTIKTLKTNLTELDVGDIYLKNALAAGGEGASFEPLICFGKNCAEPHHDTDATRLSEGDSVILDVGLLYKGYCSDMTRTVFMGNITDEQKYVYDLVLKANGAGRNAVRPGVPLKDVDAAARRVIEDAGYGEYFIHRTGHGIGLEVHEFPDVSTASEEVCAPGMVFSIEPGIYLPGRFGVRIEDLVCVTEDGCETLNRLSKEPMIVK